VGALSVAAAVALGGCGSSSGEQQSGGAGAAAVAGVGGSAAGVGGSAAGGSVAGTSGAATGSSGHASGGSAMASGGSAGGGGSPANVYVDELRTNIVGACLPRDLPFGATGGPNEGRVACTIGELHFGACDCEQPGRAALAGELLTAFKRHAEQSQLCGAASGVDCAAACGCELIQLPGTAVDTASELYACQNDVTPPAELAGYCVIDQEHMDENGPAPIGNAEIVANCPADSQRRIVFVGAGVPSTDAATFIACVSSLGAM
jgi:hypothetical protein